MGLSNISGTGYYSVRMAIEAKGFYFHRHAGKGPWSAGARKEEQVAHAFV